MNLSVCFYCIFILTNSRVRFNISITERKEIMPIITKENKILLLVLALATILAWLIFGPDVLKYMGRPFWLIRP